MDGIIIINKEKGCTSHDIVHKAKKIFNEKVGHTGTLDPNATGVLPLLIGKGTLLSKYLIEHDKIYEAVLKLGQKRDTADEEGKIIEEKMVNISEISKLNVEEVLKKFIGIQEQIPPIYSAIKVNGKKLYDYARKNESVEIKPRKIEIYSIELININLEQKEICFKVLCSKGTYIRTLCEDIAQSLNTVGYMKELKRCKVGNFLLENAVLINELEENINNKDFFNKYFISIEENFKERPYKKIEKNEEVIKFLNGVSMKTDLPEGVIRIYDKNNKFIGTGYIKNNILKRDIIII